MRRTARRRWGQGNQAHQAKEQIFSQAYPGEVKQLMGTYLDDLAGLVQAS